MKIFGFFIFLFLSLAVYAQDANQIGSDIGNSIKDFYMQNRDTMNDKLYTPGNDAGVQLNTISGESGPGNFNCTSEVPYAEILYYPSGSGDINLVIKEDLDLDGNYEYLVSLNGISGICTTGVLVCDPGSTDNCKYYQMTADNTGKILFANPQSYTTLIAACYYINASAGNVSTDFPEGVSKVLTDISGIVSNLISNARDFVGVVSYKDYQNFTVKLSGTRPSSCVSANSDTLNRAKSYYSTGGKDDSSLQADVDALKTGMGYDAPVDGMDPAEAPGVYEYASTSPSLNSQPPPEFYQCTIKNEVYVSEQRYYTDGGCLLGYSNPCSGGGEEVGHNLFKCSVSGTDNGCGQTYKLNLCGKWETGWDIPDDKREYIEINGTEIHNVSEKGDGTEAGWGRCSGDTTQGTATLNSEPRSYPASNDFVYAVFEYRNRGGCNGTPSSFLYYYYKIEDHLAVSRSNNCPTDPSCKLEEEWVCEKDGTNCIKTYSASGGTSATPSTMCYSFTTELDNYVVCSDGGQITVQSVEGTTTILSGTDLWFYIKRKYTCERAADPNMPGEDFFDNAVKTRESIYSDDNKTDFDYDSATGQYSYKDYVAGQGAVKTGNLTTVDSTCNKVCRVKVKASQKSDYSAGTGEAVPNVDPNSSSTINAKDTLDYVVLRECVNDTCQYDPNSEEVLADCFCLKTDDSIDTETLSGVMSAYEASKDIICSSSPP